MGMRQRMGLRFKDEIEFLKGWKRDRTGVGAIMPTSAVSARKMAGVIQSDSGLPVLELGPGTGVITNAILARGIRPQDLTSIEYSPEFCRHLRVQFPHVDVRCGDAFARSCFGIKTPHEIRLRDLLSHSFTSKQNGGSGWCSIYSSVFRPEDRSSK
ncbi:hypothetical protein EV291_14234 [Rhizobium sp. BK068]|nr:hypothetical protein EV291_14234 [Rhizobium sp. BK068]